MLLIYYSDMCSNTFIVGSYGEDVFLLNGIHVINLIIMFAYV